MTTYLRRETPQIAARASRLQGLVLERLTNDIARYRVLFRQVGAEWLWFGRLELTDAALHAVLADPHVAAFAAIDQDGDAGLLEIDFRNPAEAEITYFGLVPRLQGRGFGRTLMAEAFRLVQERQVPSIMLHTCDLDAPGAIAFYQKMGFEPYRRAVEVLSDPRLSGLLPREAAARIPLIEH
jgi:ribosomal protein S18 acetylase RimI-like enzyme